MMNNSFSPWPCYSQEEVDTVSQVLRSNKVNYWTGMECREFENEFASWCGAAHAVSLANGTLALDFALKVLGICPGDEVVVPPSSYLASASCVVTVGAIPVFAEVDSNSRNITAESIRAVLTPKTKAVICVHLAGWPCDMDSIMELAREHGLYLIEDCAQAHGAHYRDKPVGSIGDIGCWSFCQDKIITTGGEGGMVTLNNRELWSKIWSYKDHGKSWEAVYEREHPPGFRWVHESFGTNGRMTEMQASIGRIQLKKMDQWHRSRRENASAILSCCDLFPELYRTPRPLDHIEHAWYKCVFFVRPEGLSQGWTRDKIIEEINSRGVPSFQGGCPEIYLEKAFLDTGFRPKERFPVAKLLGETSMMFLVHPTLTKEEIDLTCSVIKEVSILACR